MKLNILFLRVLQVFLKKTVLGIWGEDNEILGFSREGISGYGIVEPILGCYCEPEIELG